MAERDQQHKIDISNAALNAQHNDTRLGQIFGFSTALAAFGTAIAAMWLGYPVVAGIVGGTTVVGLVTAFVVGRKEPPESAEG